MTKAQTERMMKMISTGYGMFTDKSSTYYLDKAAKDNLQKIHSEFKSTLITRISYMAMRLNQYSTGIHSKKRMCEFNKSLELELTDVIIPILKELNNHEM